MASNLRNTNLFIVSIQCRLLALVCLVAVCSCGERRRSGSPAAYPPECPYRVAYMHGGHLPVKIQPGQGGWSYYEFSPRANGFPYAISQDGNRIAYSHSIRLAEARWQESIEVEDLVSHKRLSPQMEFEAQSLSFSPSGEAVAFLGVEGSMLNGRGKSGLFVWNLRSGTVAHVTENTKLFGFGVRPCSISWLGDEHVVIEGTNFEMLSFALNEPSRPVLLGHGQSPSVSPDGTMLAFCLDGRYRLQHLNTAEVKEYCAVPSEWDSGVVWSQDSRYIAYVREMGDSQAWGIFVMRVRDSEEFFITSVDGWQRFLCFIDEAWLIAFRKSNVTTVTN